MIPPRSGATVLAFALSLAAAAASEEPSIWKPLRAPDAGDAALSGICFPDAMNGWAVGGKGLCLATKDGGQTWARQDTNSGARLRCVRFTDAANGFACGDGDPAASAPKDRTTPDRPLICGTLLSTSDGGRTWKATWVDTNYELRCVEATGVRAVKVGTGGAEGVERPRDGQVLWTEDEGVTWSGARCYRRILDMRAADERRWLAVGANVCVGYYPAPADPAYAAKSCRALFSDDGGKSWNASKGADGRGFLRGLAVRKGAPAVAVGDQGEILVSSDGGERWKAVESGTKNDLRSAAWSPNAALIVAVGKDGAAAFSADGAKTWKAISAGAVSLNSVTAAGDAFVAVGEKGAILRAEAKDLR